MITLTPLAEYGKQKNLSRQRIYQLKSKLNVVDLPLFVEFEGVKHPVISNGQPVTQQFVVV